MSSQRIKFKSLQVISGLTIVVTLAGLFGYFTNTAQAQWLDGWHYRRKLTFTGMNTITETLNDFPVLVTLNSSRINYNQTQDAGQDLRFTDANGNILDHEIEKWDEAATSYVWVRVPTITSTASGSTGEYVYIYYGNPSASDAQNAEGTWDSNFEMVQHLKETSGTHYDSTFNNKDSTSIDVAIQGSAVGQVDGADDFELGSTDDVQLPLLSDTNTGTMEAWIKLESGTNFQAIMGAADTATSTRYVTFRVNDSNRLSMDQNNNGTADKVEGTTTTLNTATLYHVAVTTTGSAYALYVDGVSQALSVTSGSNSGDWFNDVSGEDNFSIGNRQDSTPGSFFDGIIDEVRVSTTARSAEWIEASYKSGADTLIGATGYGAEEKSTTPIAHWRLDEKDGLTLGDSSSQNNDLNMGAVFPTNGSQFVVGKIGGAVLFDGSNDQATMASNATINLQGDLSVGVWVKATDFATTTDSWIIHKDNGTTAGYAFGFGVTANKLALKIDGTAYESDTTYSLTNNIWHHFGVTLTSTTAKFYLDGGQLGANVTAANAPPADNSAITLRLGSDNTTFLTATLDDVKLYDFALTSAQILKDYNESLAVAGAASFGAGTTASAAQQNWALDGWHYRRKITFTGMVTITETLNNFPVLVTLNSSRINYNQTQNSGQDLRFTDANGQLLDHEIENWNEAGTSNAWVKIPSITAASTGEYIYLYYGNPSATDAQNAQGVWDSNYKGVWHLTDLTDSTANANTLSSFGSIATTAGKVALAYNFDGTDDYLETTSNVSNLPTSAVTVEVWQNVTENRIQATFQLNADVTTDRIQAHVPYSDGTVYWDFGDITTTGRLSYTPSGILGTWTYYAFTSQSGVGQKIYRDGNTTPAASDADHDDYSGTARKFTIGIRNAGPDYYKGIIDEVRVSNVERSPEWLEATYKSSVDTLIGASGYGAEEKSTTPIAYWTFDDPINSTTSVYDESNNNYDGTVNGASWVLAGKFSGALSFDGNDYVELPPNTGLGSNLGSVSMWFKTNTDFSDVALLYYASDSATGNGLGGENELHLDFNSTEQLRFYIEGGATEFDINILSSGTYADNTWHQAAATWDISGSAAFYIDGSLIGSVTHDATNFNFSSTWRLGRPARASRYYTGFLDDVRVYNYARSAAEVLNDYNRGLAVRLGDSPEYSGNAAVGWWNFDAGSADYTNANLKGCWRLNEGTGSAVNCVTGTATALTGATWANGVSGDIGLAQTNSGASFDGVDDRIAITEYAGIDIGAATDSYTVTAWFKTSTDFGANMGAIITKDADGTGASPYQLVIPSTDVLRFNVYDGTNNPMVESAGVVNDGLWHFAVGVRDVSTDKLYLYLDGVEANFTTDTTTATTANNDNIVIGNGATTSTLRDFNGQIDEAMIYNRTLTAGEIYGLYLSGKAKDKGVSSSTGLANNNDGQLYGPTWRFGTLCAHLGGGNNCLEFDGTNDYVNTNYGPNLGTGSFSISQWVKPVSITTGRHTIFSAIAETGDDENITIDYTDTDCGTIGEIRFSVRDTDTPSAEDTICTTILYNGSVWYHFVAVFDAANTLMKFFVNGVLTDSTAITGNSSGNKDFTGYPFYVGARNNRGTAENYLAALVDDVRFYDYALTQKQIMQLYNRAKPVAHYKLDEGAGLTAYDESDYNNDGTLTNFPTDGTNWVTGKFGKALVFDGTDDIITVTDSASVDIGQQLTATGWFKVDDTADVRAFVEKNNEYLVRIDAADTLRFYIHDGVDWEPNLAAATTPTAGVWNHFAAIWDDVGDANSMKIYLNGKLDAQQTRAAAAPTGTTSNLILGNRASGGDEFDGALDEIKVYNYALTEAEILRDFNNGLAAGFGN